MNVDAKMVRQLAEMLADTGLTEIEVTDGDRSIRVARGALAAAPVTAVAPVAMPAPAEAPAPAASPAAAPAADLSNAVRSPMVGTAYLFPEPGADPFVKVGDTVKAGDTLLIVEAMKVMNPIAAPRDGTVRQILIENAQPIEYDQPLIVFG
ncbi:MAG: acetyl-CoA carboxylase biotin carboxyl carrier protein [Altererythrobacter sp.]|nr:acetyl-CoA carboxylase biotin carboxyl carrier protein [Altererythrobacter sp.]OJU59313.1 MAG: acetyl-CoA carboxylase, biotin carboxyl carrier protein [Altererythrobacter sp. 66-12]